MNTPLNQWDLIWTGEWELWQGVLVALVFSFLAWFLYRGELARSTTSKLRFILPTLRIVAIFLVIITFAGPVLRTTWEDGERGRILVFLDSSESMALTDEHMDAGRKLVLAQQHGFLPKDQNLTDFSLRESSRLLREASDQIMNEFSSAKQNFKNLEKNIRKNIRETHSLLSKKNQFKPVVKEKEGVLLEEIWENVKGSDLASISGSKKFKSQKPDQSSYLTSASSKEGIGDNYIRRLHGYLHPPISGDYIFWIYSDDYSSLRINSNGMNPQGAKEILNVTQAMSKTWDSNRKSSKIKLTAGQKYNFEIIHKEGNGGDFVAVGWTLPDGKMERPIPGIRFSAPSNEKNPSFSNWIGGMKKEMDPLLNSIKDSDSNNPDLWKRLAGSLLKYSDQLEESFNAYAKEILTSGNESILSAMNSFEDFNRWNRATRILTKKDKGLLANLSETHLLEVRTISGNSTSLLWENESSPNLPTFEIEPVDSSTDLATGIWSTIKVGEDQSNSTKNTRAAAVLFSDGGHNRGGSPLEISKLLAARNLPIHTVGLGSNQRPPDLAVLSIQNPSSVFKDDRVRGTITLKDDLIPGTPFHLLIKDSDNSIVWDQNLSGLDVRRRAVEFDFPAKELVEKKQALLGENKELILHSVPLRLKVEVEPIEGESELANNVIPFSVDAVTRKNRLLILDGRPRWETRYLKNLFERDERWDVTCVWGGIGSSNDILARGKEGDVFPDEKNILFSYDLIVYGELEANELKTKEQEWIRDFVGQRGGGLLFLDGPRQILRKYSNAETEPVLSLLPVRWKKNSPPRVAPRTFSFNQQTNQLPALILEPISQRNRELWKYLPVPAWAAPVEILPNAEIFLQAQLDETGKNLTPLLAGHRFGAGKALYAGFDETWKWRFEVGDKYHQRYWNQLISWIMEKPFAVSDSRISLDVGGNTFSSGEKAVIRARLRDENGKPAQEPYPEVDALLWNGTKVIATIPLQAETGGLFLGETPQLGQGNYRVSLRSPEFLNETDSEVEARFLVKPIMNSEKSYLTCNVELLKQMADLSGGTFLLEEQAGQLNKILKPVSSGRMITSELVLWQSYWWFAPIFFLLAIELLLRKRAGML